jgi:hypothetical protein
VSDDLRNAVLEFERRWQQAFESDPDFDVIDLAYLWREIVHPTLRGGTERGGRGE